MILILLLLFVLSSSFVCVSNTGVSVEQWKYQIEKWSTLPPKYISCFTASNKDRFQTDAIVVITTYNMVAFNGQRSAEAERAMDFITKQEWGLVILDEVHVAPAKMFRKVRQKGEESGDNVKGDEEEWSGIRERDTGDSLVCSFCSSSLFSVCCIPFSF